VTRNVFKMSAREKKRLKIENLPATLGEALDQLEKDSVIIDALGPHLAEAYLAGKRQHWNEFLAAVHPWELEKYLGYY
jgi:glutamine synthetase